MSKKVLTPEQKVKRREYMREYNKRYKARKQGIPAPANVPDPVSLAEQIRFKLNALDTQIQSLKKERDTILQELRVILTDVEIQSPITAPAINRDSCETVRF